MQYAWLIIWSALHPLLAFQKHRLASLALESFCVFYCWPEVQDQESVQGHCWQEPGMEQQACLLSVSVYLSTRSSGWFTYTYAEYFLSILWKGFVCVPDQENYLENMDYF